MKIFENHFLTFDNFPHQNGRILMRWVRVLTLEENLKLIRI